MIDHVTAAALTQNVIMLLLMIENGNIMLGPSNMGKTGAQLYRSIVTWSRSGDRNQQMDHKGSKIL